MSTKPSLSPVEGQLGGHLTFKLLLSWLKRLPPPSIICYVLSAVCCSAGAMLILGPAVNTGDNLPSQIVLVLTLGLYALALNAGLRWVGRLCRHQGDTLSLALLGAVFWSAAAAAIQTWSWQWPLLALGIGGLLSILSAAAMYWSLRSVATKAILPASYLSGAILLIANGFAAGGMGFAYEWGSSWGGALIWDGMALALLLSCSIAGRFAKLFVDLQQGRLQGYLMLTLWLATLGHAMLAHYMHLDELARSPLEGLAVVPWFIVALFWRSQQRPSLPWMALAFLSPLLAGLVYFLGQPGLFMDCLLALLVVPWALLAWRWRCIWAMFVTMALLCSSLLVLGVPRVWVSVICVGMIQFGLIMLWRVGGSHRWLLATIPVTVLSLWCLPFQYTYYRSYGLFDLRMACIFFIIPLQGAMLLALNRSAAYPRWKWNACVASLLAISGLFAIGAVELFAAQYYLYPKPAVDPSWSMGMLLVACGVWCSLRMGWGGVGALSYVGHYIVSPRVSELRQLRLGWQEIGWLFIALAFIALAIGLLWRWFVTRRSERKELISSQADALFGEEKTADEH